MNSDNWVAIALEEYKTLRAEILQSLRHLYQILGLTLATTGIIIGLGLEPQGVSWSWVVFVLVVPAFAMASYSIYAIEFARMVRAGCYLKTREILFRERFGDDVIGWEMWDEPKAKLRKRQIPFYVAVPAIFLGISLVSNGLFHVAVTPQTGLTPTFLNIAVWWWSIGISVGLTAVISICLLKARGRYTRFFAERSLHP